MAKRSKGSGKTTSVTVSTVSQTSKPGSFVVSNRLNQSEISSLKQLSKRVNAVSLHGSKVLTPPTAGTVIRKSLASPKDQVFVERCDDGRYAIIRGGSQRASAITSTQAEAIARAKQLSPDRPPLVERVRNTDVGQRDKWRKA